MKKYFLLALSLGLLAYGASAQSTKKVTQPDTSINTTGSTITFTNMPSKLVSVQASVARISGALNGKVYFEHTVDGNWIAVDSLVLADATVQTKIFPVTGTKGLSYRVRYAPGGTSQTSRLTASYLRRTDE